MMQSFAGLGSVRATLLPFVLLFAMPLLAAETDAPKAAPQQSTQRVYLDPVTGRLTDRPATDVATLQLSPLELNMISSSHEGLEQRPLPGGGYMLDLKGRFQHMSVATIDADGKLSIREVSGTAFLPPPDQEQPAGTGNDEREHPE